MLTETSLPENYNYLLFFVLNNVGRKQLTIGSVVVQLKSQEDAKLAHFT